MQKQQMTRLGGVCWYEAAALTPAHRFDEPFGHFVHFKSERDWGVLCCYVKNHATAWPFLKPVDKTEVPDYYDHIKYPMDLRTMGERLKARYYSARRLFVADMTRIFTNCRVYNSPDTEYYR
ncbi:hypothetical protein EVAR_96313_1 [Eumeta japonica]|uniref:Bromo domain-containing protein n=1 Tax=Eumeta variegata TaxID=151549 RepID=A0A4C1VWA7_EUMVA|nr:hypothetical protein EVAR_96313_1 [Eumeta japonica]